MGGALSNKHCALSCRCCRTGDFVVLFLGPFLVPKMAPVIMWAFGMPSLQVPFLGRKSRLKFACPRRCYGLASCQVEAFWRQLCYLRKKFASKKLVFLNLDATSIGYNLKPHVGCIVGKRQQQASVAKVKQENYRGCFTYAAIICTDTKFQGKLPHYLLGNRARLTKAVMRGQAALLQTNLNVLRQDSAWNSTACMMRIFQESQHGPRRRRWFQEGQG